MTDGHIALIALLFSGVSLLVSCAALRFTKATKIAEMRKELVMRHVAICDAVYKMRACAVLSENPSLSPTFDEALSAEDSQGLKNAHEEAQANLAMVKKASDAEVIRLYGQELPSLDSLGRGMPTVADDFAERRGLSTRDK